MLVAPELANSVAGVCGRGMPGSGTVMGRACKVQSSWLLKRLTHRRPGDAGEPGLHCVLEDYKKFLS